MKRTDFLPTAMAVALILALTPTSIAAAQYKYRILHTFTGGKDGGLVAPGFTLDGGDNAYGMTFWGGAGAPCGYQSGCGVIFELSPDANGPAGAPYGMAQGGDKQCGPCGLIFKLAPQKNGRWQYSVLHTFHGPEGADPYGVILDSKGNIFGATEEGG
jgi:hypothetical protein